MQIDTSLADTEYRLVQWGLWARQHRLVQGYGNVLASGKAGGVDISDGLAGYIDAQVALMGQSCPEWKTTVELYFLRGLTMRAIAVRLGVSKQRVANSKDAAIAFLHGRLVDPVGRNGAIVTPDQLVN